MSSTRRAFQSALIAERVVDRVRLANMDLDDKELIALGILITLKSSYRAKELREHGIGYSADDPTIASLIKKGLVKQQGKALIPDQTKARAEMSKHKRPHGARDWPASFDPPKSKQQIHQEQMADRQRAWDQAMGKLPR